MEPINRRRQPKTHKYRHFSDIKIRVLLQPCVSEGPLCSEVDLDTLRVNGESLTNKQWINMWRWVLREEDHRRRSLKRETHTLMGGSIRLMLQLYIDNTLILVCSYHLQAVISRAWGSEAKTTWERPKIFLSLWWSFLGNCPGEKLIHKFIYTTEPSHWLCEEIKQPLASDDLEYKLYYKA